MGMRIFFLLLMMSVVLTVFSRRLMPSLEAPYVGNIAQMAAPDVKMVSSAQGFAIYGNYAFQFRNKGQCHVIDLKKKKVINTFNLKGNKSHCNNANFGLIKYNKNSEFPLLYISECKGSKGCMVTDIRLDGTNTIVQRIYYDDDAENDYEYMDWTLDKENGFIYTFGSPIDGLQTGKKILRKFRLPQLSDSDANGEVHFKKEDILETIVIDHFLVSQGSCIHHDLAYLPEGYNPLDRKLHVYDLRRKELVRTLDLNALAKEPEGLDIKGRWLYVSFHQSRTPRGTSYMRFRL